MCFPPAIIAATLALGGSGLKYFGDKKAARAQEGVNKRERLRQQDMTLEQQSAFEDSLKKTGEVTDPAAMKAAADKRNDFLQASMGPASALVNYLPGAKSAPAIVGDAAKASVGKEKAAAGGLAAALAALGGTTDQMQNLNIGIGRNSQKIGQVARNKAGSAGVMDAELRAAAFKGSTLRGLGQLAQIIGQAVGAGAGGGIIPGAGAGSGELARMTKFAPAGIY